MPIEHAGPFDLVVLGAGSGGMAAAKRAAKLGAKVAIVERERVGGTCVLRGCVPKKLMVYAAELMFGQELFADYGIRQAPFAHAFGQVDWGTLVAHREALITKLEAGHTQALERHGIHRLSGVATFLGPRTLTVNAQPIHAKHVLIATGAHAAVGDWPGAQASITSDGFFAAENQPKQAIIVGGGYIAVELAGILARLKTACTLVCRSTLLRGFDHDLVQGMREGLAALGVTLLEHTACVAQHHDAHQALPHSLTVQTAGQSQTLTGDWVLTALGRAPQTDALHLHEAGVTCTKQGGIITSDRHETNAPGIYAVGDVTGQTQLTPVAIRQGRQVAHALFDPQHGGPAPIHPDHIPTAVFGAPPMASVGLSEQVARTRHGDDVAVRLARYTPLRASMGQKRPGAKAVVKVVSRPSDNRVLGLHMLGDDAPEIIQGLAVGLSCNMTVAQLDATVALHPSQAEEFVLLGEA